jgi:restriction endonuclease, S subunit
MKSNYKAIGELVERVDERNRDASITTLIGVSIDKKFIPSVANVIGTDLTNYKVIRKFDFAVSLMQVSRDEKIPVACQKEYEAAIMSPAYPIFRVKDTEIILPEYMEMWFMRNEFDREASFVAVGGVRGSMPWEEFAKLKLPVPTIEEQRKIVDRYNAITDRITLKKQINDNLAEYLNCIYFEQAQAASETISLSAICKYVSDKAIFSQIDSAVYISTENILPDKQGISSFGITSPSERVTYFQAEDVLVSNIRPYFKKMWFATTAGGCNADVLCFRALDKKYSYLLKSIIYQDSFFDYVMSGAKGTKMPRGDKTHIMQYQVPCFSESQLHKFNSLASTIERNQAQNRREISALENAKEMLLATLSR